MTYKNDILLKKKGVFMNKKIQGFRNGIQIIFFILLLLGFYFGARQYFKYLIFLSVFAGNYFCGWVCPYGTIQEFFGKIGNKLFKKKYKMPHGIQKYLQFSKYIIYFILMINFLRDISMSLNSYKIFMISMGNFSNISFTLATMIMLSFIFISMMFERPFCNYLCTESFKYSVVSVVRPITVKRDESTCVKCKKCDTSCPMNIRVSEAKNLRSPQCINCFKCVSSCPVENTLTCGHVFKK
jgi:polyferredoxin